MAGETLSELAALMARLRAPDGCPWDREQDHDTLKTHLVEEAYEVIEAIESRDREGLCEELGDLLLQVVFHAQIAAEAGEFTLDDVIRGIHDKLVRRHPHVFGDLELQTSGQVLRNWEAIKAAEKGAETAADAPRRESVLDGTPKNLPPLVQAYQLTSRAARVGFDWQNAEDIFDKLAEETGELRASMGQPDRRQSSEELGDLLFVVVNLARHLHIDPEVALRRTNQKFISRFRYVEEQLLREGKSIQNASLADMDRHWEDSKRLEP